MKTKFRISGLAFLISVVIFIFFTMSLDSTYIEILKVSNILLFLTMFYLLHRLSLKIEAEEETDKKLELLKDCEKFLPTLSTILQQLLKTDNSVTKKELVSLLVKNINEDNLDFLMLYINQAKLYEAVEKHCEDCLSKLDPNKDTFQVEKAQLEEALQGVRFKSSRLFDHLFGKPA